MQSPLLTSSKYSLPPTSAEGVETKSAIVHLLITRLTLSH